MARLRRALGPVLFAAILLAARPGHGLDFGDGPALLIADQVTHDEEAGVVTAEGNVEVTRGTRRLRADAIR
jgi:lipopolysaccharide export system protein LptA